MKFQGLLVFSCLALGIYAASVPLADITAVIKDVQKPADPELQPELPVEDRDLPLEEFGDFDVSGNDPDILEAEDNIPEERPEERPEEESDPTNEEFGFLGDAEDDPYADDDSDADDDPDADDGTAATEELSYFLEEGSESPVTSAEDFEGSQTTDRMDVTSHTLTGDTNGTSTSPRNKSYFGSLVDAFRASYTGERRPNEKPNNKKGSASRPRGGKKYRGKPKKRITRRRPRGNRNRRRKPTKPRSGGRKPTKNRGRKPTKPRSGGRKPTKNRGRKPTKPRSGGRKPTKNRGRKPTKPRSGGRKPTKPRSGGRKPTKNRGRKPTKPRSGGRKPTENRGRKPTKPRSGGRKPTKNRNRGRKPTKPRSGGPNPRSKPSKPPTYTFSGQSETSGAPPGMPSECSCAQVPSPSSTCYSMTDFDTKACRSRKCELKYECVTREASRQLMKTALNDAGSQLNVTKTTRQGTSTLCRLKKISTRLVHDRLKAGFCHEEKVDSWAYFPYTSSGR